MFDLFSCVLASIVLLTVAVIRWLGPPSYREPWLRPVDMIDDRDARIALLRNYSSSLRAWFTSLLAIAAALFALFQAKGQIHEMVLTVGVILLSVQVPYVLARICWHGMRSQYVLSAWPVTGDEAYLYRLDVGARALKESRIS